MQKEYVSSMAIPIGQTIEFQNLMWNICVEIGKRLRVLRKARGWSQEALGERANLHPTYIGGIERGERNPSVANLAKLAQAFGISLSALVLVRPEKDADIDGQSTMPNESEEKAFAAMSYLVAQTAFQLLHARRDPGGVSEFSGCLDKAFTELAVSTPTLLQLPLLNHLLSERSRAKNCVSKPPDRRKRKRLSIR